MGKKRSADPTPAADPKADPYYYYGLGHYGLGYGLGYYGGYGHYLYGKRSADPTPDPTADPYLLYGYGYPYYGDTMAITCMERGLPTLLLLLTLRLTPTFSMATTAMATAILTMVVTTGAKLFLECQ